MVTLILHGGTELSALALTTSTRSLASAHIHRSLLQEMGRSAGCIHLASDDHICRQSVVKIVHKRILVHHKLDMSTSLLPQANFPQSYLHRLRGSSHWHGHIKGNTVEIAHGHLVSRNGTNHLSVHLQGNSSFRKTVHQMDNFAEDNSSMIGLSREDRSRRS